MQEQDKAEKDDFVYFVDQFGDIRILKYRLPDFGSLSLNQKTQIYFLSQAALSGRDILWAQNFRYNLIIRKFIEFILSSFSGERENEEFKAFLVWSKRVLFSNGIHHHYSQDKFKPGFTELYFRSLIDGCDPGRLPVQDQDAANLTEAICKVIFDESLFNKKVELGSGTDLVKASAVNHYENVTQEEVEKFYSGFPDRNDPRPVSRGLNTKVIKKDGKVTELVYRSGGLYGEAIDRIIFWLTKAMSVAENTTRRRELELLVSFYKTGDLRTWDEYNITWAGNNTSDVDYINGFIETYEDPLGKKATWESVVDYTDRVATRRMEIITANAQWFEDNSPIDKKYRKEKVTGVAARVINIAMLGGDCYPASPLGINLPNADWIRKEFGSKSVTLANIAEAHDTANRGGGLLNEFAATTGEIVRAEKFAFLSDSLHTDLHECIGHASGKLAEGCDPKALKNYHSTLEEARADLFGLYFMLDPGILDLGLLPCREAAMAGYDAYLRNGLLTQLVRIKPGKNIEESHMRARAIISGWAYEKGRNGNGIELFRKDGKTFVTITDYEKVRRYFGDLLKEIQRIKSEGDYEAGRKLVENYGVKVDRELNAEIVERYEKLGMAPFTGFVNPRLVPVTDESGSITDIKVEYTDDFLGQMLEYGKYYSFLPVV